MIGAQEIRDAANLLGIRTRARQSEGIAQRAAHIGAAQTLGADYEALRQLTLDHARKVSPDDADSVAASLLAWVLIGIAAGRGAAQD